MATSNSSRKPRYTRAGYGDIDTYRLPGIYTNDRELKSQCASYFYGKQIDSTDSFSDQFKGEDGKVDFHNYWGFKDKAKATVGQLDLQYLYNSRIMSSWIGGPHGWCNWNGYIGCSNYNIGKHPSVEEVCKEWQTIATTFPYLSLKSQLIAEEGEGNIAIEFEVKDGIATIKTPGALLEVVEDCKIVDFHNNKRERGCIYEKFVEAVDYTRTRIKQSITSETVDQNTLDIKGLYSLNSRKLKTERQGN